MEQTKQRTFAQEVNIGLSAKNKHLSSKYFYDKIGDQLFVNIMHCDEYYLTNSELEIFQNQSKQLIKSFNLEQKPIHIIELGAGNGLKTTFLLKEMLNQNINFSYLPIDISKNAIENLKGKLRQELPKLNVIGKIGDYFQILEEEQKLQNVQKIILFLGSNLGNLTNDKASEFLAKVAKTMSKEDKLLLGLDIKKEPKTILAAYNDKQGYTRDFNLNILRRINVELGGDFQLNNFIHFPNYEPKLGRAVSYLVSTCNQKVTINALNKTFEFREWETIHTEISQKYDLYSLQEITKGTCLKLIDVFYDSKKYFMDALLTKH